jgi:hypothetical protein
MQRFVSVLAATLCLAFVVACGGSSTSSVDQVEVAEGVAMFHEWQHLRALAAKGIHRLSMAEEYGTATEVQSLKEAESEILAEAKKVEAEGEAQPRAVQQAVAEVVEAEEAK